MIAPPRLASRLLRACAPRADAEWIVRDLEEGMQLLARSRGLRAAKRWYWAQVLRSLPPLVWRRITAPANGEPTGGDGMWHELRQDFSYAMRLSGRSPLTTAAVVATIILGVGVTTAVFSVVDAVVIRPLPFDGSSRTVQLFGFVRRGAEIPSLAYPDLQDFRARSRSIEALGIGARASATIAVDGEPQRLNLVEIDSGFVRVLGLRAGLGRFFANDEFTVEAPRVIVLANGFWRRAFGANPDVIGKTMALDGAPHVVIGVLPEGGFTYPTTVPDAMIPLRIAAGNGRLRRGAMWAEAIARLRPGVSVDEAQRELSAIAEQIGDEFKDSNEGIGVRVKPLRDAVVGPASRLLALLGAGVAAVLLIACLNVGNLLLARASTRAREFAVRAALGGSRARIRRQVLTESVFLAIIGGAAGAVVAPLLTHAIVAYYPGELPRAAEVGINYRVAAAALLIHVASIDGAFSEAERDTLRDILRRRFSLDDASIDALIDEASAVEREAIARGRWLRSDRDVSGALAEGHGSARRTARRLHHDAGLAGLRGLPSETLAFGFCGLFLRGHRRCGVIACKLALAIKDRLTQVSGERRSQHRDAARDLAIAARQVHHLIGGSMPVGDGLVLAGRDDLERLRPQRHPGDAGNGERTDGRAADDDAPPEAHHTAGAGAQNQGVGRGF